MGSLSVGALLAVAAVLALGAISPGASCVRVARLAVTRSRAAGVAAALGMGVGCAVLALAALLGLQTLLSQVPVLHRSLTVLGAGYLLWIAARMWRGAGAMPADAVPAADAGTRRHPAFVLGLLTQLTNPQTALVFAGVFAAVLPAQRQPADYLVLPLLALAIDAAWFAAVAWLLSAAVPRALWLRARRPLDRVSAVIMALLGLRLIRTLA